MQEEIEAQRAGLVEDVRRAKEESDRLGTSTDGSELAYENLKSAEVALHDFEVEHPSVS